MNAKMIRNVDEMTTKVERKAKKVARKGRIVAILLGLVLFGILASLAFINVSKWYDENKVRFQSPVVIRWPVIIERRVMPIKQEKRKEGAVQGQIKPVSAYAPEWEEAYDTVWLNESGRGMNKTGLNGYCLSKGMINEIGYAPHESYCFHDSVEQKETFMLWLNNRLNHVKMPYCDTVSACILAYTNGSYTLADK